MYIIFVVICIWGELFIVVLYSNVRDVLVDSDFWLCC